VRLLLLIGLGVVPLFCGSVRADVIEIGADGRITIYRAPSVFSTEGVRALAAPDFASASTPAGGVVPVPSTAADVGAMLSKAAQRYGLDENLLKAVAWQESHFNRDAVSSKGAVGVMQLMEDTARTLHVDRRDTAQNILGGAAYLRALLDRYGGDRSLALAAYNAGPEAVDRSHGMPAFPETRNYVRAILTRLPAPSSSPILLDR
jgi:soluble lytic murein transglycosylase-like protein